MIWLLLILFVPGGKNQHREEVVLPSYKVIRPCDANNILAIMTPPRARENPEYNLLMPSLRSGSNLILKFDSPLILSNCEPGVGIRSSKNNTFYIGKNTPLENSDRRMNCKITIPKNSLTISYVESIVLNGTHQLCENPKNHYFDDFIVGKITVAPNTASSKVPVIVSPTISNKTEEKNDTPQSYFERLSNQEKQYYTIKNEQKTVAPDISSTTISNIKEEKNDTPQSYFEHLSNQEKQYYTIKNEQKTVAPDIASTTISNIKEEKNNDNEFKSTTIRSPLLLSIMPNGPHLEVTSPNLGQTCGRQKVLHAALIVHGQASKAAHWPWHVALNRIENFSLRYICGGTLLSKTVVLTAGHCASIKGGAIIPELLRVHLGKHDLFGRDVGQQEREVFQVTLHPGFDVLTLDNDIALLKLKSEVIFTDYVQPACLWYEQAIYKLPPMLIFGTVAGWGFDHQDSPSYILQQITIPLVTELTCLKSNPTFFHKQLNSNKFCAGFGNGTAVCNGDSGGGLMIFVPETPGGSTAGAWHVRGIVSVAPRRTDRNVCDPDQFTIFTDVEKYRDWVLGYLY